MINMGLLQLFCKGLQHLKGADCSGDVQFQVHCCAWDAGFRLTFIDRSTLEIAIVPHCAGPGARPATPLAGSSFSEPERGSTQDAEAEARPSTPEER
jgi:hypothetical protein